VFVVFQVATAVTVVCVPSDSVATATSWLVAPTTGALPVMTVVLVRAD
jgi:hypothetical protein